MKKYRISQFISQEQIEKKVEELAKKIKEDYKDEEVLLVGLLKGSTIFLADLIRKLDLNSNLDFIVASSYGLDMDSSRDVRILKDLDTDIKNKNVLIVEDIIDTGYTLSKVTETLKIRNPKSIKICTLLDKPSRREIDIKVDYIGFQIEDKFVVGYGIDYAEKHRGLPYVGYVEMEG
ncbi:hypoxanthine phosphoribosyltransferase [Caviibacter abscessus]|uniref:hypoxanthine phosphoribosyltransferase n=1 Tax=Caviibacter abscessus TaxID=1766719 RepID=UPI00082EF173|nr:hypoxanthine phosphoribosyltransferase [Caviibacter abscessus]